MARIHRYWFKSDLKELVPPTRLRPSQVYFPIKGWICLDVDGGSSLDLKFLEHACLSNGIGMAVACLEQTGASTFQSFACVGGVLREISKRELASMLPVDPWQDRTGPGAIYYDVLSSVGWMTAIVSFAVVVIGKSMSANSFIALGFIFGLLGFSLILRRTSLVTRLGGALLGSFFLSLIAAVIYSVAKFISR